MFIASRHRSRPNAVGAAYIPDLFFELMLHDCCSRPFAIDSKDPVDPLLCCLLFFLLHPVGEKEEESG